MMMVLDLIFLVVIAGALAYALGWRPRLNQTSPPPPSQTPVEILNARHARGEINREEYDKIRRDLEG